MRIPTDILYEIFSHLNLPDLLFAAKVCREWHLIARLFLDKANDDISIFDKLMMKYKTGYFTFISYDYYLESGIILKGKKPIFARFAGDTYVYNIGYYNEYSISICVENTDILVTNRYWTIGLSHTINKECSLIKYFTSCLKSMMLL